MIEFDCEHCETKLSIAPEQLSEDLFCPYCENPIELPELPKDVQLQLDIALAQIKNIPKDDLNYEMAEEMLQHPASKETVVWKERLAQSFQASSFKDYVPEEPEEQNEKEGGIKKLFGSLFKK